VDPDSTDEPGEEGGLWEARYRRARQSGRRAGTRGLPPTRLPYSAHSRLGRRWVVGYLDGLGDFFTGLIAEAKLPGGEDRAVEDLRRPTEQYRDGFRAGRRGDSPHRVPPRLPREWLQHWADGYREGVRLFFSNLAQAPMGNWSVESARILLLTALAIALLVYPALYVWILHDKFAADLRLEQARVEAQQKVAQTLALLPMPPPPVPAVNPGNGDAARVIEHYLDAQRSSSGTTSAPALGAFIDSLASAGVMIKKQAEDLKSAIQKAAIDGGKEIVVDLAKNIVGAIFKSEPSKDANGLPKNIEINVTQNNNNGTHPCTAPTTCRVCQPKPRQPPGPCGARAR
jgi:hypothetical protein